jgi:hypothetical protein
MINFFYDYMIVIAIAIAKNWLIYHKHELDTHDKLAGFSIAIAITIILTKKLIKIMQTAINIVRHLLIFVNSKLTCESINNMLIN